MIKTKTGRIIQAPTPNILQKRMFSAYRKAQAAKRACKMIILKPRQKGASTAAEAIAYHHQRRYPDLNGSLMGDIRGTSDKVFEIYRRYAQNDNCPWNPNDIGNNFTDKGDQADVITLCNQSVFNKETAGSRNAGRSGTIQVGSMTEVAFWQASGQADPALAYLQSLYDESEVSLCVADSTPNGPQGWFYNTYMGAMEGRNDWVPVFAAWFEFADSYKSFESDEAREEFLESLTEDERVEQKRYNVSAEQLNWRRYVLHDKCEGDVDKFRQEYPSDQLECFLKSSRPRFNSIVVDEMMKNASQADFIKGNLNNQPNETVSFTPDREGNIYVAEQPRLGCRYLVSADVCTGEDQQTSGTTSNPDFHSVQVWRQGYDDAGGAWHMHRLVALHHSRADISLLAEDIVALSRWYGNALIIPEVNNCGLALVKYLLDAGVPVYQRRKINDSTQMEERFYGWQTLKVERKTIIDHLASMLNERELDIPFDSVVQELSTFVVNKRGKPEAAPGKHDDHVLAAAIAVYNLDTASEFRESTRKRKISLRRLKKDPTYLCPDGYTRQKNRVPKAFKLR